MEQSHSISEGGHGHGHGPLSRADLVKLSVGALGVVYGDIGTSPIYAVHECMAHLHIREFGTLSGADLAKAVSAETDVILAVISLIFWSLILVVFIKYIYFVMRADNRGEGGILALLALIISEPPKPGAKAKSTSKIVVMLGLFGAALLFADGMITPSISVLSAIEGLQYAASPVPSETPVPISPIGTMKRIDDGTTFQTTTQSASAPSVAAPPVVTPSKVAPTEVTPAPATPDALKQFLSDVVDAGDTAAGVPVTEYITIIITVIILLGLFGVQRFGTSFIGGFFGPTMFIWFSMIAIMGVPWIVRHPEILKAASPHYAAFYIYNFPRKSFFLMGSVVLCITGAEALYADMGHFGRIPIRVAWSVMVFPCLIINYMGQGAFYLDLLGRPDSTAVSNALNFPFFAMVGGPSWLIYPVIFVATAATIIASQALISGAFSLTQQAMQLGYCPRLTIVHTSHKQAGQIYIPEINWILMVACVCLVLGFRTSNNLAAAYGIAVMGTMGITTSLLYIVAMNRWKWPTWKLLAVTAMFLATDIPFLVSNLVKIKDGGWFPLLTATGIFVIMTTWYRGRMLMAIPDQSVSLPLKLFLDDAKRHKPHRVEGSAVFMASSPDVVPNVLLHHFKHNQVLHRQVILLHVDNKPVPHAFPDERLKVKDCGDGFFVVEVAYGFMEDPDIPEVIAACAEHGLKTEPMSTSYYLGRASLLPTGRARMVRWRKSLFSILYHNEQPATAFFQLPPNRVIELGRQIEL